MMEKQVIAKIEELKLTNCHPKMVDKIARLIDTGDDFSLYKINAFRIAEELQLSKAESLRGFLYATRLGIFDMSWDIYCPSCTGLPEYYRHMMGLTNRGHCLLCEIDWELDFEKQVEVTFTINPALRVINFSDFAERDFEGMMEFINQTQIRENRQITIGDCIFPNQSVEFLHTFLPGVYNYWITANLTEPNQLLVDTASTTRTQKIELSVDSTGSVTPSNIKVKSGPVQFIVTSSMADMKGFLVAEDKPINNWVSAHYVSLQQDFKDLFDGEFLSPDTSFSIQNLTLMFTDLKDSTQMYEDVGDSTAFTLVKKHFGVMTDSIRQFDGGIIKTIGDAVMAAFPDNSKALQCAVTIQQNFLNKQEELSGLQVKIGIHRGSVIAVNSNNHLDYFGRTVNMAARVQGKSLAGEVLLSEVIYQEREITDLIAANQWKVTPVVAQLKGIKPDPVLYSISPV
jgi:class 3 adenylate cyclase